MSNFTIPDDELIDCGLTQSQQEALDQLRFFHELHERRVRSIAGISTRATPLIVGPSGSGKTFLVSSLAVEKSLPMFAINAHNWIPLGARNEGAHTLIQILRFIGRHPRGIIFIDEVNKLTVGHAAESSWCADVLSELLAFLDMDVRLETAGFSVDQIYHLFENFFVIGAGAFQGEWRGSQTREIGFAERSAFQDAENYRRAVESQTQVADELLFRFNEQIITIAPPTAAEFGERIQTIRGALCIPALGESELRAVVAEAVQSGRMVRWLEGYTVRCMSEAPDGIRRGSSLLENLSVPMAPPSEFVPGNLDAGTNAKNHRQAFTSAYQGYVNALQEMEPAAVAAEFALADLWRTAKEREESGNDCTLISALCDARKIFRAFIGKPDASLVGAMRWLACHAGLVMSAESDEDRCKRAKDIDVLSEGLKRGLIRFRGCIDGEDVAPEVRPAVIGYLVASQRLSAAWQILAQLSVDQE